MAGNAPSAGLAAVGSVPLLRPSSLTRRASCSPEQTRADRSSELPAVLAAHHTVVSLAAAVHCTLIEVGQIAEPAVVADPRLVGVGPTAADGSAKVARAEAAGPVPGQFYSAPALANNLAEARNEYALVPAGLVA